MCGQRGRGENDCSFESLLGRRSSHRGDETGRANDLFPDRIPWSTVCSSESIFSTNGPLLIRYPAIRPWLAGHRRQLVQMRRREFIALLGGAAVAWPLAGRTQQTVGKFPKIGFLQGSQNENVAAFIQALQAAGYTDGQNVRLETRIYGTM